MSKTVLIATEKPFSPEAVDRISEICNEVGYTLKLLEKYIDKTALIKAVENIDALIIRSDKVTGEVLKAAKKLKVIVRAGSGYDNVDCAAASKKNIAVMNTPGQNSNAVAELTFGLMIALARKQYQGTVGTELRSKRIGIYGYGNVGKCIVKIANGFGMKIEAFGRSLSPGQTLANSATASKSAGDLFLNCDYISLNLPLNSDTQKLITYELLSTVKTGATVVNTARKEIIDEPGLMKMMEARPDFLYASDIAPDCRDEMREKYPERCIFTLKKMGAQTTEANMNAGIAAIRQIIGYLGHGNNTFQVN